MRQVWWNGDLIPESEARLSIYDSALMFGDTVFEMTRSFNKKHFKLREHLERLYASARYLHIDIPMSFNALEDTVYLTVDANKSAFTEDDEYRVMIDVTRGLLSIYHNVAVPHKGVNVIISVFPLKWTTVGMGKLFDEGVNLVIPSQRQIPAHLLEPKVKNRNRIHYLMANIEASQMKGENNWPILLDPDGFVTEGPGYNFFIVEDGDLVTPNRNILKGISREYLKRMEWAEERDIELYDIYQADEAFITATPFCMLPVTSLNGVAIGDGKVGPAYQDLLFAWNNNIGLNIKAQIQKWDSERKEVHEGVSPYGFKHN